MVKHYLKKETLCNLVFTIFLARVLIVQRTNVSNIHIEDVNPSVIIDDVNLVENVKPGVLVAKQRLGNGLTNELHTHVMENDDVNDYDPQQVNSPVHDGFYLDINVIDIIYIVGYIIFVLTALSSGILIKFKQRPRYHSDD